jgi:hypothetical protein
MNLKKDEKGSALSVFVSYSHADKKYKDELSIFLTSLLRQGKISLWVDNCIEPGQNFERAISDALSAAGVVLLLISPDFIASDYCYERELATALEMHEKGDCIVVPVIIRPCDWHSLSFGRLQALPQDGKPVTTWSDRDVGWHDVARSIRRLIEMRENEARMTAPGIDNGIRSCIKSAFRELVERYESRGSISDNKFSLGLGGYEWIGGGLGRREVALIIGNIGKWGEALLVNAILENAGRQKRILVLSPRISGAVLARNLMVSLGKVSQQHLISGDLDEDDWPRISNAIAILSSYSIYVEDFDVGEGWSGSQIDSLVAKYDPQIIAIPNYESLVIDGSAGVDSLPYLKRLARSKSLAVICSGKTRAIGSPADSNLSVEGYVGRSRHYYGEDLLISADLLRDIDQFGISQAGVMRVTRDDSSSEISVPFKFHPETLSFEYEGLEP